MYYLFAIWENIKDTLCVFEILLGLITVVGFIGSLITCSYANDDDHKFFTKLLKKSLPYFISISLINVFIPTQKQLAFTIAAPYIIENQDLKDIGKNSTEIIKLGTEYVKDVLKEKVKE